MIPGHIAHEAMQRLFTRQPLNMKRAAYRRKKQGIHRKILIGAARHIIGEPDFFLKNSSIISGRNRQRSREEMPLRLRCQAHLLIAPTDRESAPTLAD